MAKIEDDGGVEFVLTIKQVKEIRVLAHPEEMSRFVTGARDDCETMSSIWRHLDGAFHGDLDSGVVGDRLYADERDPVYELKDGQIFEHGGRVVL